MSGRVDTETVNDLLLVGLQLCPGALVMLKPGANLGCGASHVLGSGSRGESCSAEQRHHSITAVHKGHLARILLLHKQAVQASRLSQ